MIPAEPAGVNKLLQFFTVSGACLNKGSLPTSDFYNTFMITPENMVPKNSLGSDVSQDDSPAPPHTADGCRVQVKGAPGWLTLLCEPLRAVMLNPVYALEPIPQLLCLNFQGGTWHHRLKGPQFILRCIQGAGYSSGSIHLSLSDFLSTMESMRLPWAQDHPPRWVSGSGLPSVPCLTLKPCSSGPVIQPPRDS